jgi:hypothetical protein
MRLRIRQFTACPLGACVAVWFQSQSDCWCSRRLGRRPGAGAIPIDMKKPSAPAIRVIGMSLMLASSMMSSADTPPTTQTTDPCKTEPCFKANNRQSASAADLKSEPRDLSLQYPGEDLTAISPKDAVNAAGNIADATGQFVKQAAGPLAGAAVEVVGTAATAVTATYDVVNGATAGSQNGGGVVGGSVGALQAGIATCAGAGAAVLVTAACAPVLGPAAPAVGVVADTIVKDATTSYLNSYQLPVPTDNSFGCAKIGICAESDKQALGSAQDEQSEIDSVVADETKKFNTQWTSAMSGRLDQLQVQLTEAQSRQNTSGNSPPSWVSSAAALAIVAAHGKNLSALACAENIMSGGADPQCLSYAQSVQIAQKNRTISGAPGSSGSAHSGGYYDCGDGHTVLNASMCPPHPPLPLDNR